MRHVILLSVLLFLSCAPQSAVVRREPVFIGAKDPDKDKDVLWVCADIKGKGFVCLDYPAFLQVMASEGVSSDASSLRL